MITRSELAAILLQSKHRLGGWAPSWPGNAKIPSMTFVVIAPVS